MARVFQNQIIIVNQHIELSYYEGIKYSFKDFSIIIHEKYRSNLYISNEFLFYGECFMSEYPEKKNKDILTLLVTKNKDEIIEFINRLSGYFFFLFKNRDNYFALNDCASQFEIYFFNKNKKIIFASQPHLMFPFLEEQEFVLDEEAPNEIIYNKINIFDKTPFKYIFKLIPNHLFLIQENKLIRFFPNKINVESDLHYIAKKTSKILENSILAYSLRRDLAIGITAGLDSRVILASSRKIKNKELFVIKYDDENGLIDTCIASQICLKLGHNLNIFIDEKKYLIEDVYPEAIWKYDERKHLWSINNYLRFRDKYIIDGNLSEIVKNQFDHLNTNINISDLCFVLNLKNSIYVQKYLQKWVMGFSEYETKGFCKLDFIYWENQMSNWIGYLKSISSLYNFVLSPFNNRELLALMLSIKKDYRDNINNKLYYLIINNLYPVLNDFKINPTKKTNKIKTLKSLGIYKLYMYLHLKIKKYIFKFLIDQ